MSCASVLLESARSRMLLRLTLPSAAAGASLAAVLRQLPPRRLEDPSDRALPGFDCMSTEQCSISLLRNRCDL